MGTKIILSNLEVLFLGHALGAVASIGGESLTESFSEWNFLQVFKVGFLLVLTTESAQFFFIAPCVSPLRG